MAAALDEKEVAELKAQYRALAEKGQRRVDELEQQNAHLIGTLCSSLVVPASAFGLSYARAYYGERASILGIPIDAAVGVLLKGLAALLGFFSDKGAQVAAKVAHDVANGALASWSAAAGAELGLKKRMEKPVPAPQPNTGVEGMPAVSSRAMTHEDLAAITSAMAMQTAPAMSSMAAPMPVPAPSAPAMPPWPPLNGHPAPVMMTSAAPQLNGHPAPVMMTSASPPVSSMSSMPAPPLNGHPAPVMTSGAPFAASTLPSTPQKPFRFTQRWAVDPEADMHASASIIGSINQAKLS